MISSTISATSALSLTNTGTRTVTDTNAVAIGTANISSGSYAERRFGFALNQHVHLHGCVTDGI